MARRSGAILTGGTGICWRRRMIMLPTTFKPMIQSGTFFPTLKNTLFPTVFFLLSNANKNNKNVSSMASPQSRTYTTTTQNLRYGESTSICSSSNTAHVARFESFVINRCKSGTLKPYESLLFFGRLNTMKPTPSIWAFNHLFGTLCKMKKYSIAVSMYQEMNVQPDISTMNILITCFCRLNRLDFGFSVLSIIFKRGIQLVSITVTPLLCGLCAEGKVSEAVELFRKSSEMAENGILIPDVFTCNLIIGGLCKERLVDEALNLFRKMNEKGNAKPNVSSYNLIIGGLCLERRIDEALKLFREMDDEQGKLKPDVICYNKIISGFCKERRIDDALILFREMDERGRAKPNVVTYSAVIDGLCNSNLHHF